LIRKSMYGDPVADTTSAAKAITQPQDRTPEQVRAAQLVLVSMAMGDGEREAEIQEVLRAVGIFNKDGVVETRRAKIAIGLQRTNDGRSREDRPREPNGRLSRARGIYQK